MTLSGASDEIPLLLLNQWLLGQGFEIWVLDTLPQGLRCGWPPCPLLGPTVWRWTLSSPLARPCQAPGAVLPFPPLPSRARATAALGGLAATSQLVRLTPHHCRPSAAASAVQWPILGPGYSRGLGFAAHGRSANRISLELGSKRKRVLFHSERLLSDLHLAF